MGETEPLVTGCNSIPDTHYPAEEGGKIVWKVNTGMSYSIDLHGDHIDVKQYTAPGCPSSATPAGEMHIGCGSCRLENNEYKITDQCPAGTASFAQKSAAFSFLTVVVAVAVLQK